MIILFYFPFNREAEEFEEVEKKLVSFSLIMTCLIFRNFALIPLDFTLVMSTGADFKANAGATKEGSKVWL